MLELNGVVMLKITDNQLDVMSDMDEEETWGLLMMALSAQSQKIDLDKDSFDELSDFAWQATKEQLES